MAQQNGKKLDNPGAGASVTAFDSTATKRRVPETVRVAAYVSAADANVTHQWAESAAGTLRTVSTTVLAATTFTPLSFPLYPGRNVIKVNVVTASATFQVYTDMQDV